MNRDLDNAIGAQQFPRLPADRMRRIEAAVMADLKPVRPLMPEWTYLAGLGSVFIAVCIVSCYLLAGQNGWEALNNVQRPLVFVPLLVIAALLVFSVVRQMTPAARYARVTSLAAAAVFALLLAIMPFLFHPEQEAAFVHNGLVCFRSGMLFAIPTGLLLWLLLSRGAGLSPSLTGAAAGGLAGLAGLTVLEIHCPNLNVYHIVASHISVVLACALAGFILSSVTFSRRVSKY